MTAAIEHGTVYQHRERYRAQQEAGIRIESLRQRITDHQIKIALEHQLATPNMSLILEAIEEIRGLTALLKALPSSSDKRDEYEGRLYAALTHLDHHVKPAIKEWDRVVDRMADD